jgi:U3 small nucleolar RNA-associated protein 16
MFSTIYNSARRILSRSPSAQDLSSEPRDTPPTSHHIEVTMVTTRRGTETPGQDPAATPRSSGKRRALKRELEVLDTPTAAKRQKKTTPKKKVVEETQAVPDSAEDTSDTVNAAITDDNTPTQAVKLPIRRQSSPKVIVAKLSPPVGTDLEGADEAMEDDAPASTQDAEFHTPEPQSGSVYATPVTTKKSAVTPTPRATRASERTSSAKKSSARKNAAPVQQEKSADATTPTQDATVKKAHMRFGSEEPEVPQQKLNLQGHKRYEAPTPTQPEIADSDDDASDSDEAPEVVTTSAAASKAKASQADAARAQRAQQEKERAKREAREQRIAEEQAEKRKREEKKAKKLAKQLAKQQQPEPSIEDATPQTSIDLAGLLPTELLSNIPDQRAPTPPPVRGGKTEEELRKEKLRHHIKFLERTDKGIKDVKKGKLSIAVLGQHNRVLPPKANRGTRDVREKWLKGREVKKSGPKGIGGKTERKSFGNKGFLRADN